MSDPLALARRASAHVLDTHALFWYLVNSPRLSEQGRQVFQSAFAGETMLVLSPIVLLELYGLTRKVEAPFDFATELALFERPPFHIEPITVADLRLLARLNLNSRILSLVLVAFIVVFIWAVLPQNQQIAYAGDCSWCQWGGWYYWYTAGDVCRNWDFSCWLFHSPNEWSLCHDDIHRRDCTQYGDVCYYQIKHEYPKIGCCWKPS